MSCSQDLLQGELEDVVVEAIEVLAEELAVVLVSFCTNLHEIL
jgi:hypothetical protein